MKKILYIFFVIQSTFLVAQQNNTSMMFDNYVNCFYSAQNPSSIVDSRSKLSFYTNYNQIYTSNFFAPDYLPNSNDDLEGKLYDGKKKGFQNRAFEYDVFGAKIDYNIKNSFAYAFRFRWFNDQTGIPEIWNGNAATNYSNNTINVPENIKGFSYNDLQFTEHALSYGRVIFDKETSLLKGGISVKFLNGISAEYLYANSGTLTFTDVNISTSDLQGANFSYGKDFNEAPYKYKNRGIGFDIGFTYEIRPDYVKHYYDMDGEANLKRYDINKYKWKFCGSITDIGYVNFYKDTLTGDYSINSSLNAKDLYHVNFDFQGPSVLGSSPNTGITKFKMNLPTTLHLGADYQLKNNWYASYNMSLPLIFGKDPNRVRYNFIQTITPRLEKEMYSIMVPLSMVGNGKCYVGLAGRFMYRQCSIYMGSNNIMFMFGQKASLTRSFYFGGSFNVLYKTPKDRDKDKVSDLNDQCPDDKGPWSLRGCPDTDGDGILDKDDYCVYDAGSIKTRGCPDRDGDGIIDMNDRCPDEKGLGVHLGCPDKDFDGVIDVADKCPDVPGIELNNGCPFENQGCCMDKDGDGVTNEKDKCPDHSGSVYNDGCPIDKDNIDKINLNDKKEDKDPNHTENQLNESNLNTVDSTHIINSVLDLQKVLEGKNINRELNLYFNFDQASLTVEEQEIFTAFMKEISSLKQKVSFVVIGYTDKDGSLDYNLILSKKRAETVKRKITDLGYSSDLITVYYYGETKALYKENFNAEQKRLDRKVSIMVVIDK